MTNLERLAAVLALFLLLTACGGGKPPPPPLIDCSLGASNIDECKL